MLAKYHLPAGWAILMETETGDIKSIVNLTRLSNGKYAETIENIPFKRAPVFLSAATPFLPQALRSLYSWLTSYTVGI